MIQLILKTPLWAWVVLTCLIFLGFMETKDRWTNVYKLFIVPLILLALKIRIFFSAEIWVIESYALPYVFCFLFSYNLTKTKDIKFGVNSDKIFVPGSWRTMIQLMIIFTVKWAIEVASAIRPDLIPSLTLASNIIFGTISGMMMGKSLKIISLLKK